VKPSISYDTWAEIDLGAVCANVRALKRHIGPETKLMAVVKSDGYGHGAVGVARAALGSGAEALGVARADEGILLRRCAISAPILIFGHTSPALTRKLLYYNLSQTIWDMETARNFSERAIDLGARLTVHIKIDTGMGRLGIPCTSDSDLNNAVSLVAAINRLPGLWIQGIYTHFATADHEDKSDAMAQYVRFSDMLKHLESSGVHIPVHHAANTAAAIDLPETRLDMVRSGIGIYGVYPSLSVSHDTIRLVPAMTLKSRIIQLKEVGPGFAVSYGHTARTRKTTTLATVAIGYGDGFPRLCSNQTAMLVRGRPAPIIGRVCMDQTILDVGHIPGVCPGDEVIVFGSNGSCHMPVETVADCAKTISYEILTGVSKRVKKIYINPLQEIQKNS